MILTRRWRAAAGIALLVTLAACGGGGGGGRDDDDAPHSQAPLASISVSTDSGAAAGAPLSITFDGSGSRDPDGTITSYTWSFGDGQTASGAVVSHEYPDAATYTVTLTVTDNDGITGSATTLAAAGGDPLFPLQWYLANSGQSGGLAGQDINVQPAWAACGGADGCRGEGVRIVIVDDGLELAHEDLAANIVAGGSYNYLNGSSDPTPADGRSAHGTAVAGIAAARDGNSLGIRGVASRAGLVGYNLLQNATSSNQADAMVRGGADVAVSTNSWGAPDRTGTLQAADFNWLGAVRNGLATGRGGRGIVYVWAGGNGHTLVDGLPVDNSNYDGQANYYGTLAVAALDTNGQRASYSERGANLWVSAPGGRSCGAGDGIVSTDLSGGAGINTAGTGADLEFTSYTRCMNGTSSSAPMVAGVAALVLQADPSLSWRDVKLILAKSARKNDAADVQGWTTNGAGIAINHNYGFGAVDADAAVRMVAGWSKLPALRTFESEPRSPNLGIPDNDPAGVSDTVTVSGSGIGAIEFVEVHFSATDHTYSGDLEITLTNVATGTSSVLAETHLCECQGAANAHNGWRFGSARHLDEAADGAWRLTVKDQHGQDVGTFQNWRLVFYGH